MACVLRVQFGVMPVKGPSFTSIAAVLLASMPCTPSEAQETFTNCELIYQFEEINDEVFVETTVYHDDSYIIVHEDFNRVCRNEIGLKYTTEYIPKHRIVSIELSQMNGRYGSYYRLGRNVEENNGHKERDSCSGKTSISPLGSTALVITGSNPAVAQRLITISWEATLDKRLDR